MSAPSPESPRFPWDCLDALRVRVDSVPDGAWTDRELARLLGTQLSGQAGFRHGRVFRGTDTTSNVIDTWPESERSRPLPGPDFWRSLVPGRTPLVRRERPAHPGGSELVAVAIPFQIAGDDWLALELGWEHPPGAPGWEHDQVNFAWAAGEWLGHNILRSERAVLRAGHGEIERLGRLAVELHRAAAQADWGDHIATLLQSFLACDRAWLVTVREGLPVVRGSSLPGNSADRARQAANLREVLLETLRRQAPLLIEAGQPGSGTAAEEVAGIDYLEQNQLRRVRIEPLLTGTDAPQHNQLLVLESFLAGADPLAEPGARGILDHVGLAVAMAVDRESRGWRRFSGPIPGWLRSRPAQATAGICALLATLLWLVPWPLSIEAEGQLQPSRRQGVFAPQDGIVADLNVHDGQPVTTKVAVLRLRSPQLDEQVNQVTADLGTKTARLATLQSSRGGARAGRDEGRAALVAEQEELEAAIAGLKIQIHMLDEQRESLTVRSPIDGVVDRWNAEELLAGRPVTRGQELLRVLDLAGPWQVELLIPEEDSGYIVAALRKQSALPVRLQLLNGPGVVLTGELATVEPRTEVTHDGRLVLRATIPLESPDRAILPAGQRAGSGVVARIDCGRRSLGFVWFRRLLEFVWRRGWW